MKTDIIGVAVANFQKAISIFDKIESHLRGPSLSEHGGTMARGVLENGGLPNYPTNIWGQQIAVEEHGLFGLSRYPCRVCES